MNVAVDFDTEHFETKITEASDGKAFFDSEYYASQLAKRQDHHSYAHPSFHHYLTIGEALGLCPSLFFDPAFYIYNYPDLIAIKEPLLFHYVLYGLKEGRVSNLADSLLKKGLGKEIEEYQCLPYVHTDDYDQDIRNLQHLIGLQDIFNPAEYFSPDIYYKLYPDVKNAGLQALSHYLTSGIKEKRKSSKDVLKNIIVNEALYDPTKPIIIVGGHELSKTGAPLVALNIAMVLKDKYNIVFMAHKGGALESRIEGVFFASIVAEGVDITTVFGIEKIRKYQNPIGAIFSSIECDRLIETLADLNIPSVLLIHEYTEYTFPTFKKYVPLMFSEAVIYSSRHLRDSWKYYLGDVCSEPDRVLICAQPQTVAETEKNTQNNRRASKRQLGDELSLELEKRHIIIGAGQVQVRKGTDLFIQVANHITKKNPGKYFFVWIGEPVPDTDIGFGVWFHTYLHKTVDDNPDIKVLPAGKIYNLLQSSSDAFILPSRLDPLPNVVLDALAQGQTLFYFDDASGVREFIESKPEYEGIASPYLDVFDMASKIEAHFAKGKKAQRVKKEAIPMPQEFPDYEGYAHWLVGLVEQLSKRTEEKIKKNTISVDVEKIGNITTTHKALAVLEKPENDEERQTRIVNQMLARGACFVNPAPGISGYHVAKDLPSTYNAFLIDDTVTQWRDVLPDKKVFMHVHAHFTDLFGEILDRIVDLGLKDGIIVTTNTREKYEALEEIGEKAGVKLDLHLIDNRGRDIGPFIDVCAPYWDAHPEAIFGHLHTKKSEFIDSSTASVWRDKLLRTLLNPYALSLFGKTDIKLLFPDDTRAVGWGQNLAYAKQLQTTDASFVFNEEHPGPFPIGNMFWVSGSVAKEMRRLTSGFIWPSEPVGYDGSILHAIERLWPWVCHSINEEWATIYDRLG